MKHNLAGKVEAFDPKNEFHQDLLALNAERGRGEVVAIVWDRTPYALKGVYVTQLQNGMQAYKFRVTVFSNGYELQALGRRKGRASTHFDQVWSM